jgi:hypothetical protein
VAGCGWGAGERWSDFGGLPTELWQAIGELLSSPAAPLCAFAWFFFCDFAFCLRCYWFLCAVMVTVVVDVQ